MSKKDRDAPNISNLGQHSRERKTLKPPFSRLPRVELHSWRDERLPKILWAVILSGNLEREAYLDLFRRVLNLARSIPEDQIFGLDHHQIAKLSQENFSVLFDPILADDVARERLGALLLFDGLPDRSHWEAYLERPSDDDAFGWLANGVAVAFDHQSQEATDCRWVRLCAKLAIGKMHFAPRRGAERVLERAARAGSHHRRVWGDARAP